MNTTLTTFLKIGVTVIVIVALLFSVGYQTVEDEVNHYISDDITNTNHDLNTTGSMNR
jgi:amino acid transporter